jgi:hypothetical protein
MTVTVLLLLGSCMGSAGWLSNRKDGISIILAMLVGTPVFLGIVAQTLADFQLYHVISLSFLTALYGFTGAWRMRRIGRVPMNKHWLIPFILLAVLASVLFSRPHQYLHGGWDPGEYISSSAQINRLGSIRYTDPLLPELSDELHALFSREPNPPRATLHAGFLVLDRESGTMTPDYFHFYPAWLSLFQFNDSLELAYYGHTIIAVIAVLTVFIFALHAAGPLVATLTGVGVLANPAVLYFGRFPSSEMMSMALLFGCFTWILRKDQNRSHAEHICFLALTAFAATTCHIINLVPLAAMTLVLALYAWRTNDRSGWGDTAALTLGVGVGFLRNSWAAPEYLQTLWSSYILERPGYVIGTCALVAVLVMLAYGLWMYARPRLPVWLRHPLVWRCAIAGLVVAWGLYQYVVRPRWGTGPNVINLLSLGWLFSPVGLILIAASFFIKPPRPWTRGHTVFLVAGILTTLILVQSKYIQPYYMWAFRRYTPLIIPFFGVLLAYTVARLACVYTRLGWRSAVMTGFAALVGWQIYQARTIVRVQEHQGLPQYVEELAGSLPKADFILMDHWKMATPLRIACGLPAYQLSHEEGPVVPERQRDLYAWLKAKLEASESVLYLSHAQPFYMPGYHPVLASAHEHQAETLRWTRYGIPQGAQIDYSPIHVFRFEPGPDRNLDEVEIAIAYHGVGLIRGFHSLWRHSGLLGRWTNGDAALYIPGLVRGGKMSLTLSHGRPESMPVELDVTLYLDGKLLDTLSITQGWDDYEVELPPTDQAAYELALISDTWDPAIHGIYGYPTNLGISITGVHVTHRSGD